MPFESQRDYEYTKLPELTDKEIELDLSLLEGEKVSYSHDQWLSQNLKDYIALKLPDANQEMKQRYLYGLLFVLDRNLPEAIKGAKRLDQFAGLIHQQDENPVMHMQFTDGTLRFFDKQEKVKEVNGQPLEISLNLEDSQELSEVIGKYVDTSKKITEQKKDEIDQLSQEITEYKVKEKDSIYKIVEEVLKLDFESKDIEIRRKAFKAMEIIQKQHLEKYGREMLYPGEVIDLSSFIPKKAVEIPKEQAPNKIPPEKKEYVPSLSEVKKQLQVIESYKYNDPIEQVLAYERFIHDLKDGKFEALDESKKNTLISDLTIKMEQTKQTLSLPKQPIPPTFNMALAKYLRDKPPYLDTFRPPKPELFGTDPLPVLETKGEAACSTYALRVLQYYYGPKNLYEMNLIEDNTYRDAWWIKKNMLQSGHAKVETSMQDYLSVEGGTVISPSAETRNDPEYQTGVIDFMRAAHTTGNRQGHPSLITFLYANTNYRSKIASEYQRGRRTGSQSLNSHVTTNYGLHTKEFEGKMHLNPGEDSISISEFIWREYQSKGIQRDLLWMADGLEIKINGKSVSVNDRINIKSQDRISIGDVILDHFFNSRPSRTSLFALLASGKFDPVDVISIQTDNLTLPYKFNDTKAVVGVFHLNKGQTVEQALLEKGIAIRDLQYHIFAYQQMGLNLNKATEITPIPFFDTALLKKEFEAKGGLEQQISQYFEQIAVQVELTKPDETLIIIKKDSKPSTFLDDIFSKNPIFKNLSPKMSEAERRFAYEIIDLICPEVDLGKNEKGGVRKFNLGTALTITPEMLKYVKERIEANRKPPIALPNEISWKRGHEVGKAYFPPDEIQIIENATADSTLRIAMLLILGAESKGGIELSSLETSISKRNLAKKVGKGLDNVRLVFGSDLEKPFVSSIGMFHFRPSKKDMKRSGVADYPSLRYKIEHDKAFAANLVQQRLKENDDYLISLFRVNREAYNRMSQDYLMLLTSIYHAGVGQFDVNMSVCWQKQLKKSVEAISKSKIADIKFISKYENLGGTKDKNSVAHNWEQIGFSLRENGKLSTTLSDDAIKHDAKLALNNLVSFISSPLFQEISNWYQESSGQRLTFSAIDSSILEQSANPLSYGFNATTYGTLKDIFTFNSQSPNAKKANSA